MKTITTGDVNISKVFSCLFVRKGQMFCDIKASLKDLSDVEIEEALECLENRDIIEKSISGATIVYFRKI